MDARDTVTYAFTQHIHKRQCNDAINVENQVGLLGSGYLLHLEQDVISSVDPCTDKPAGSRMTSSLFARVVAYLKAKVHHGRLGKVLLDEILDDLDTHVRVADRLDLVTYVQHGISLQNKGLTQRWLADAHDELVLLA